MRQKQLRDVIAGTEEVEDVIVTGFYVELRPDVLRLYNTSMHRPRRREHGMTGLTNIDQSGDAQRFTNHAVRMTVIIRLLGCCRHTSFHVRLIRGFA